MFRSNWVIIRQFSWYYTRYRILFLIWIHISNNIVTCISDYRWDSDWWIDLLTSYIINTYLQAIQLYRLLTQFTIHCYTHTRILCLHFSSPGNGIKPVSLRLNLLITHWVVTGRLLILLQLLTSRGCLLPATELNSHSCSLCCTPLYSHSLVSSELPIPVL
jgi:hypothetical protein